jgi:hypothetical protein
VSPGDTIDTPRKLSSSAKKPEIEIPKWYGTATQSSQNDTTRMVELMGKTPSSSSRLCRSPRKLTGSGFTRLVMDPVPPESQGFVMAQSFKSRVRNNQSEGHALTLAIQSCGPPKQRGQYQRGFRDVMMAQGGVANQKLEFAVGSTIKSKTQSYWHTNAVA